MKQILSAGALALLLGSGVAIAQPAPVTNVRSVQDLAAVCDPAWGGVPRFEAIAYCQGFLTSAGQYHALLHKPQGNVRPIFCVPNPGPSIAESGLAFANWARANPDRAQDPALEGLMRWGQSTYPCPTPARAPRAQR